MPVTASIIQESFNQLVRTEHLNIWSERLGEYYGHEKGVRFMLNLLSQSEEGILGHFRNRLLGKNILKVLMKVELMMYESLPI